MRINRLQLFLVSSFLIAGCAFFFLSHIPGDPLPSVQEMNRRASKYQCETWGSKWNCEPLEEIKSKDRTVIYIWNYGDYRPFFDFLELSLGSSESINAKFIRYKGFPTDGQLVQNDEFTINPKLSKQVLNAIAASKFWESEDQRPKGLPRGGSWWVVEGKKSGKIVRWYSMVGDQTSPEGQNLGIKIRNLITNYPIAD